MFVGWTDVSWGAEWRNEGARERERARVNTPLKVSWQLRSHFPFISTPTWLFRFLPLFHSHSRFACVVVCGLMKNYNSQHQAYRAINSTERTPTRTCVCPTHSFPLSLSLSLAAQVYVCVWQVNFDTRCVWDNSLLIIFFELQFFLAALPPCRR